MLMTSLIIEPSTYSVDFNDVVTVLQSILNKTCSTVIILTVGSCKTLIYTPNVLDVTSEFYYNRMILSCTNQLIPVNTSEFICSFNDHSFVTRLSPFTINNKVNALANLMGLLSSCSLNMFIYFISVLVSMLAFICSYTTDIFLNILMLILSSILGINKSLLFAFTLFFLTQAGNALPVSDISLHSKQWIVTPLGSVLHWFIGFVFDYYSYKQKHENEYLVNKSLNAIVLNTLYGLYIFIGVFFTNRI